MILIIATAQAIRDAGFEVVEAGAIVIFESRLNIRLAFTKIHMRASTRHVRFRTVLNFALLSKEH